MEGIMSEALCRRLVHVAAVPGGSGHSDGWQSMYPLAVLPSRITRCLASFSPLPFLELSLPFLDLPLPFHCLSLTFHCLFHCLSLTSHCLSSTSDCLSPCRL